ncbi:carbohydrate ABC transporter permease [Brachybacterium sp. YJGR34]|uniref:carbohydrate ABC transporter permease n=1 Tax=Brachybacterium sp. YJGR34 TaxID=2059911 RepID=UPI000E0A7392|nr:carbohydrate ABC transporter permease [Brachybacterium sp. YJGR34]
MTPSTLRAPAPRRAPGTAEAPPRRPRGRAPGLTGLYILLVVAAVITLFPIFWLLSGSLMSLEELYSGQSIIPTTFAWENYAAGWIDGNLGLLLVNSLVYSISAVAGTLVCASLAGYALARLEFQGKSIVSAILLAVMIIPAPAMFIAQYKLLVTFGLTDSRAGYIAILIAGGIPMSTLIMRSFFASQPRALEEAGRIDGASSLRIFASIILPLARPGLAAVAVIQGLNVWNEYLMALVLFDTDALMPVQRGLMSFVSSETPQQTVLLAATTISVIPVLIFYLLAQKQIVQGLGSGAVK